MQTSFKVLVLKSGKWKGKGAWSYTAIITKTVENAMPEIKKVTK